jgi:hypothetical protein
MSNFNIVRMYVTSVGASTTINLGGVVPGWLTFALAGCQDQQQVPYTIRDGLNTETGFGTYTAAGTLFARTTIRQSTNGNAAIVLSGQAQIFSTLASQDVREVLQGNRNYYVRTNPVSVLMPVASPGVVTWTAHGLAVNNPVTFFNSRDRIGITITAANPGVATTVSGNHGFVAGDPIRFQTTGSLPHGIVQATTYWVIAAGLTATAFEFSTTSGGAAINTTALTTTFPASGSTITISAAHGLIVGQQIQFAGAVGTGFSAGTTYYIVSVPLTTTMTVSATNGGTAISSTGSATGGTLVQVGTHYAIRADVLPTWSTALAEGTIYYVQSVVDSNHIQVSATPGGGAINFTALGSGSPNQTPLKGQTGNDSNPGMSIALPFLNIAAAVNVVRQIDCNNQSLTILVADGVYAENVIFAGPAINPNGGEFLLNGANTTNNASNCRIAPAAGRPILVTQSCRVGVGQFTFVSSGGDFLTSCESASYLHLYSPCIWQGGNGAFIELALLSEVKMDTGINATYTWDGPVAGNAINVSTISAWYVWNSFTIEMVNNCTFSTTVVCIENSNIAFGGGVTFVGNALGTRYNANTLSMLDTGGGVNFLPGNAAGSTATGGQYT